MGQRAFEAVVPSTASPDFWPLASGYQDFLMPSTSVVIVVLTSKKI
jgi:hypothetical protein